MPSGTWEPPITSTFRHWQGVAGDGETSATSVRGLCSWSRPAKLGACCSLCRGTRFQRQGMTCSAGCVRIWTWSASGIVLQLLVSEAARREVSTRARRRQFQWNIQKLSRSCRFSHEEDFQRRSRHPSSEPLRSWLKTVFGLRFV